MMAIKYTITSCGKSKKGAQITVTVGEGRNRRSFTRHIDPRGFGLNIDERAIPLNKKYEEELATAKHDLGMAASELARLEKGLDLANEEDPVDDATIEEIMARIHAFEETVAATKATYDDAEAKLDIIRRELPLMMKFVGAGLNY